MTYIDFDRLRECENCGNAIFYWNVFDSIVQGWFHLDRGTFTGWASGQVVARKECPSGYQPDVEKVTAQPVDEEANDG